MKTEIRRQPKLIWKIALAVAFAIMFFALSEETAKADEVTVDTWSGLQGAIDAAPNGTSRTIQLTDDITPDYPTASNAYITIGSGQKIILDLNGHIMNRGLALETAIANGMVIRVEGELTLNDSSPASSHPDFSFTNPVTGELNTVTGGAITGGKNSSDYSNGNFGGGVYICPGARFIMNAGSIVACEAYNGGGVYADGEELGNNSQVLAPPAEFVMNGGLIASCIAQGYGGGVYGMGYSNNLVNTGACFDMKGGSIENCLANEDGGGVFSYGRVTLEEGKISKCKASDCGGGVCCVSDSSFPYNAFVFSGGEISDCEAVSMGGGVCVNDVQFIMSDGKILDCKTDNDGGGVWCGGSDCLVNMSGGIISGCEANSYGGGVYIHDGTFNMSDGEISGCESKNYGGGVYVSGGTFNMLGGEISRCKADISGGGVYVSGATFNMSGGEISGCDGLSGGGVYVGWGTFNMSGGEMSRCDGQSGDGIYVGTSGLVLITGGYYLNVDLDLQANENEIKRENDSAFIVVKPVSAPQYVAEHPLAATSYKTSIQEYYYVSQNGSNPGTVDFTSIDTDEAWSSSIPKRSIPGTYDVWVAVKGTNGKTSGPIKLSPSVLPKADPAFSTSPAAVENQVCDGTPKNLVSEGSFGSLVNSVNPTVLYAVTDTATRPADNVFTTGIPSKIASGTYYVWYRVAGDNYYNAKNNYDPITVEILEPEPAPVITAPVYTYEPVKEEVKEEPKPAVFTRKNKDGSSTTITIIRNTDGTVTTVTENKYPDGISETKSETRDAKGNGTLSKIKKDADGNVLSKTEGTIKVNKKGTETLKSVTENSDGSREEKTQKTYKRDADNIKKVTADTKKTDAAGNTEETKMTALVDGLGGATIAESSTFKYAEADGITADSKEGKESDSASSTAKDSDSKSGKIVNEERQYSLSANGRLKLLSLTSDGEIVKIPESIELDGMIRVVKSLGKNALKGNKTVREVVIGKDVTTICAGAFKNCSNLELIELTGSVKKIYKNAFKGIAKNARFVIEASEEDFARIVQLLKDSGVSDTVTFERK